MLRLLTFALLAIAMAPFSTSTHAAPQDMRVDPRVIIAAARDVPTSFTSVITLFSVNRYGPLYFGKYGSVNAVALFKANSANGKVVAILSRASTYPTSGDASAACCADRGAGHWTNKASAFQIPPIGEAGYSNRTGPDSNGLVTDTIVFRQGTCVVEVQSIHPSAGSKSPQVLGQDQFSHLARMLDARASAAPQVPLANLLPTLVSAQKPTRISRPTISNLGLSVDVAMSIASTAGAPALTLSAIAPQGATCTLSVTDGAGHDAASTSHAARIVTVGGIASWSWPANTSPVAGTAVVFCGQNNLSGAAEVSYLLTR